MSDQGKYWCFTNFETDVDYSKWNTTYLCYGVETCPETGRIHHQGYCEFASNKRLSALKKINGTVHWEKRLGNAEQAIAYCEKDGNFTEIGIRPVRRPGKRTDIDEVRTMVKEGKGMRDVIDVCSSFQALKFAEKLLQYKETGRNWVTEVYWYWGETGTGKTKRAAEEAGPDAWWSGKNLKWWQGYDAHENIIIDDFRGDYCTFHELLRILDRYPFVIEVKGGSRQLMAKKIWVTCPKHPLDIYDVSDENKQQLMRRITRVINFRGNPWDGTGIEVGGNTGSDPILDE